MPTYEYQCKACEHRFDEFQSIKDAPLRKCPACGKRALERLIGTGGAIIFKGSGFYQTDYRSETYKKAAEAESKPAGETAKSDSKPEAKPAAKAEGGTGEAKPVEKKPSKTKAGKS